MELNINNRNYQVPDTPDRPLLWVIRDEIGLKGTKFSCEIGICGNCTVHIDGNPARSCITLLSTAQGRQIKTIEGLAETSAEGEIIYHPVQQAFLDEQVPQCGWCQPAQMMTAAALLDQNPNPNNEEIQQTMS
ncbi:MAG: (2Fe-2S)-binding protein, partial [Anaerolineales bacterium]|nr:(2Fe-2S)-binding protein [Anaerolineales bacterium]